MKTIYIKELDVSIKSGELIGIIGPNGSGKTRILKKLCGKVSNNDIFIDDKSISEYSLDYKRNNIVSILNSMHFNTTNVYDELIYNLKLLKYNDLEIKRRFENFKEYFKLKNINSFKINEMSIEEKVFIKILSLLIINPKLIAIDDLLTYLNYEKKQLIINYIKEKNMIFICATSNMEEILYFDKIILMDKGKKVLFNDLNEFLKNEKNFSNYNLEMPFIYSLNNLLKDYELIKENHIVYKELTDVLWK